MHIQESFNPRTKVAKTTFTGCPTNKQGRTTVQVSTFKSGKQIVSHYQWGAIEQGEGYTSFSFMIYQDEGGRLHSETLRATEKAIKK